MPTALLVSEDKGTFDAEKSVARKELLSKGAESAAIEGDTTRAYVNDAAAR